MFCLQAALASFARVSFLGSIMVRLVLRNQACDEAL